MEIFSEITEKERNAGTVHSVSGWTRGVQVKLYVRSLENACHRPTCAVFTTRCYTTPRLPLPLPYCIKER